MSMIIRDGWWAHPSHPQYHTECNVIVVVVIIINSFARSSSLCMHAAIRECYQASLQARKWLPAPSSMGAAHGGSDHMTLRMESKQSDRPPSPPTPTIFCHFYTLKREGISITSACEDRNK